LQLISCSSYCFNAKSSNDLSSSRKSLPAIGSPKNPYLYQGKEFFEEHDFDLHYFGARMFDSELGRWHSNDPLIVFASPYNGMANNPVSMVDPTGMVPGWPPGDAIPGHLEDDGTYTIEYDAMVYDRYNIHLFGGWWRYNLPSGSSNIYGDSFPGGGGHGGGGSSGGKGLTDGSETNGDDDSGTSSEANSPAPPTIQEQIEQKRYDLIQASGKAQVRGIGLSFEIGIPDWIMGDHQNGVGFDIGVVQDNEPGFSYYVTVKETDQTAVCYNAQIEVWSATATNNNNNPHSMDRYVVVGKGHEFSVGVGPAGGSYSESNAADYKQFSPYYIITVSAGSGIDVGFANWDTKTYVWP